VLTTYQEEEFFEFCFRISYFYYVSIIYLNIHDTSREITVQFQAIGIGLPKRRDQADTTEAWEILKSTFVVIDRAIVDSPFNSRVSPLARKQVRELPLRPSVSSFSGISNSGVPFATGHHQSWHLLTIFGELQQHLCAINAAIDNAWSQTGGRVRLS